MENIITLPYSEYSVINKLNSLLKRKNCSIYIPVSRQQKGIDFIIHKNGTKNIARIQVKASRTYKGKQNSEYLYYLWFLNFIKKYKKNTADFYIIYGAYCEPNTRKRITSKKKIWNDLFLCFTDKEMYSFLKGIKMRTSNKPDKFFGIGFNSSNDIYLSRGFHYLKNKNISKYILDNRIKDILKLLK
jgi:hypothetical protein